MSFFQNIDLDFYDEELFGNEAGEDEDPAVLSTYFITKSKFDKFLSEKRRFGVVRARKGMGKSTLLSKLAYDVSNGDSGRIVISVTGSDLLSYGDFEGEDHLFLQNQWKKALSARINFELGNRIGFAWTDDQMAMVEASELAGYKGKNIAGALLGRIKSKHLPIEVSPSVSSNASALLERYMDKYSKAEVWLFVDDIDSTFSANSAQKARVSSFFSACRSLARDIEGLKVRASVRTDVWTSIRYNEDLDKCEQYVVDVQWSRSELEKIVANKILSYISRNYGESVVEGVDIESSSGREVLIKCVFMKRLAWGGRKVSPYIPLRILGARRPRWMSQLCRLSAEAAAERGMKRVGIQDVNHILEEYGRLRVNDLYKEHSHQFDHLQKLLEIFSRGERKYPTDKLLRKIDEGFCSRFSEAESVGLVDGEAYVRPLQLAAFLYKIGFILLRETPSGNAPPGFVGFEQRPELLSDPSAAYEDLVWEIQPAYRGVLKIT